MDITTIISCVITGLFSLLICEIEHHFRNKERSENLNMQLQRLRYQLDNLDKKVTAHNQLIDRVYKLEADNIKQNEQLKTLFNHGVIMDR